MFLSRKSRRSGQRGIALLIVLSMIVLVTLILVAFVTTMRLERSASASYSQSILADEFARGSANLIVADLQNEMAASDGLDSTYPRRPLFTNVTAANIQPQRIGTNAAMPLLVRTSTNTTFTNSSGLPSSTALSASTNNSATPSKNGRYVSAARWSAPALGVFPAANVPRWIYILRGSVTNGAAATFTGNGNAINNPTAGNSDYAIGRFAYAVYDVGGLLDLTLAGYPASLSADQIQAIKGRLVGADVSALGLDPAALTAWRNEASVGSSASFLAWATNGTNSVAAGDTTFLSRQDLIKAAQAGAAGLTTNVLTNLTVFSRERNAPSSMPASTNSTNSFLPAIRHSSFATITSYQPDASAFTYPVLPGDPLAMQRFPLGRLAWIGPGGPQNGGTAAAIRTCFGLLWNEGTGVWDYVGLTGTARQPGIKTLAQVASETPAREPDFFELLQAAIATGSLGLEGHLSDGGTTTGFQYSTAHQASRTLHIFRIGAAILSQYDSSASPIVVSYEQSGGEWQAAGVDNLPYLNMLHFLCGQNSANSLGCYMIFGLWNPHRGTLSGPRPPVRLRVKGSVMVANAYGTYPDVVPFGDTSIARPGYVRNLDATIELSADGVNGFIDPHALLPADLDPQPGPGSSNGMEWATLPAIGGISYAGYRLPDFTFDTSRRPPDGKPTAYHPLSKWQKLMFWVNMDGANPFNCWLEYQNANGDWVPYNYFAGINDSATWMTKPAGFEAGHMGNAWANVTETGLVTAPQPLDPPAGMEVWYYRKYVWETPDPRTLRFNWGQHATVTTTPEWRQYLNSSLWSSATGSSHLTIGRVFPQVGQKIFGPPWAPTGLARNNNAAFVPANAASPAAYRDPDGVRRLADSGLFTNAPATSGWKGNPFSLSSDRDMDRPVILNRPFSSVGELGYTCRDYPWRTLDLFSSNSADGALLDVFTVASGAEHVATGRIQLNSAPAEILTALLRNIREDARSSAFVSQPSLISADIVQRLSTTKMRTKAEIASRLVAGLPASAFGSEDEEKLKPRREATARALSDVGQIRTWNLLIDVVAQAGRFPLSAQSLDDFHVEAEKRYWFHVAIDRFTGEVIDSQIEPVTP